MTAPCHGLFERFGVELEYMIVDRETLDVLPIADRLLAAVAGRSESEVEVGSLNWSNELALHLIEVKTGAPAPSLAELISPFQSAVQRINELLRPHGARLMPTAMHPWMDPLQETRLWPHEYNAVYETFNRIFDCRGHGWSNVQSAHLNLPFATDDEFGRLHAAIRLVLPILPALAASSPIVGGRATGLADSRLEAYRNNSARVPSIAGQVIPEPVFDRAGYESKILGPIYADLAPHDPEGVLRYEWANARGAIARFDRQTIEIRVLDMQECPAADLAVIWLAAAAVRLLVRETTCTFDEQRRWGVQALERIFLTTMRQADAAIIEDVAYARVFGITSQSFTAGELWRHIHEISAACDPPSHDESVAVEQILKHGSLSRRILKAVGAGGDRERLADVYGRLADCLAAGEFFV